MTARTQPSAKPEQPSAVPMPPRPLESAALFGNRDEVLIAHGRETYRLRCTRQGKLILTK